MTCYIAYSEYGAYWTGHYVPPSVCLMDYPNGKENEEDTESTTYGLYAVSAGVDPISIITLDNFAVPESFVPGEYLILPDEFDIEEAVDKMIEHLDKKIYAGEIMISRDNGISYMAAPAAKAMIYDMNGVGVERSVDESMPVSASTFSSYNSSSNSNAQIAIPWISAYMFLKMIIGIW